MLLENKMMMMMKMKTSGLFAAASASAPARKALYKFPVDSDVSFTSRRSASSGKSAEWYNTGRREGTKKGGERSSSPSEIALSFGRKNAISHFSRIHSW